MYQLQELTQKYRESVAVQRPWHSHWQSCYDVTLPERQRLQSGGGMGGSIGASTITTGARKRADLYDSTAPDAVVRLCGALLTALTPPMRPWLGLAAGPALASDEAAEINSALSGIDTVVHHHLRHAHFAMSMHQALLDLVIAGTACLMIEEAPAGQSSALSIRAIPLGAFTVLEDENGHLTTVFRRHFIKSMTALKARYGDGLAMLDPSEHTQLTKDLERATQANNTDGATAKGLAVIEMVTPRPTRHGGGFDLVAWVDESDKTQPRRLMQTRLQHSPFICFRWMKAPGEVYGRSPVMTALPDIQTANKVVELVLKNASIAVAGIWQAEDDGVLNPANIKLLPGSVIPIAQGSGGLQPLTMPNNFDVSQIVLADLRTRINQALLGDRLPQTDATQPVTATEINLRSAEMARMMGATYGRLQAELLHPLAQRLFSILMRRGEIPQMLIDGRQIMIADRSPIAMAEAQNDVQSAIELVTAADQLGADALAQLDTIAIIRHLAQRLGVPSEMMMTPDLTTMSLDQPTGENL